jgi:hypothetical protein
MSRAQALKKLRESYRKNGYVRRQNMARVKKVGWRRYHKGEEVRLVASSRTELQLLRRLLRTAGFEPAKPFAKGRQFRQPIYGRDEVARFLKLMRA